MTHITLTLDGDAADVLATLMRLGPTVALGGLKVSGTEVADTRQVVAESPTLAASTVSEDTPEADPADAAADEKPKRKRRTKAQIAADKKAEEAAAEAGADDADPENDLGTDVAAAEDDTRSDRELFMSLLRVAGKDVAADLLSQFGAKTLPGVPEDRSAAFRVAMLDILAKAEAGAA